MPTYKGFGGHGGSRFLGFQKRDFSGFRSDGLGPTTVLFPPMPTTNWEVRKQSPNYHFYSLERFFIVYFIFISYILVCNVFFLSTGFTVWSGASQSQIAWEHCQAQVQPERANKGRLLVTVRCKASSKYSSN